MKLLKIKTARFADIVGKCGPPSVYNLWQLPAADRKLQSLLKNTRVLTVLQSQTGRDFGEVGFRERKGGRVLAFPKSLKRFCDRRIIGINWDLVKP